MAFRFSLRFRSLLYRFLYWLYRDQFSRLNTRSFTAVSLTLRLERELLHVSDTAFHFHNRHT